MTTVNRLDRLRIEHKFCQECGKRMRLSEEQIQHFDRKTGKRVVDYIVRAWTCPNYDEDDIVDGGCEHDNVSLVELSCA